MAARLELALQIALERMGTCKKGSRVTTMYVDRDKPNVGVFASIACSDSELYCFAPAKI